MYPSSLLVGAAATALLGAGVSAQYNNPIRYDMANFFDHFNFFSEADPTNGHVEYVDKATASAGSLAGYWDNSIFLGVDHKTRNWGTGRKSVRLVSEASFTHGLVVADIRHMPAAVCGVWPAFWMTGPDWPASGEIDIIEGVNTQGSNSMALHTGAGCTVANDGTAYATVFNQGDCNAGDAHEGCSMKTSDPSNYGNGFNAIGGGVYATEWTSEHISIWFFPRTSIPEDITAEEPDPKSWGPPMARFKGGTGCSIDQHFKQHQIVINTTLCGDWAGRVFMRNQQCSAKASSCEEFVDENPAALADAYWLINSIKVYASTQTRVAFRA